MAFDQSTRGCLQKLVNSCRVLLSDEFSIQLQQTYGLDPKTGEVTPMARLTHLDDRQRHTAEVLRQILTHYLGADTDDTDHRIAVIDRMVREQAFTVLNRLAALLMMEARGQLIESVSKGYQSRGYQLYSKIAGTALGETGQAYQVYLFSVFDELARELPALFDRYAANGLLFPRETALRALLDELNHFEIEPLWAEDETIGWIYQYFNSKEERKAMREASQAPRNSRELAVRNQFFTPRYVVEFLVDNTLGRLWFNATGGQTVLCDRCRYLLVNPEEQPQAAIKLRDPRTLKLLDPACGSMHFGLYAFDLFSEIYREAWKWEQQYGPGSLDVSAAPHLMPLSKTYEDEAVFLRDVPRLIIENNIYGVDIDPRAAQIAILALWLRAQRAWHQAEIKAKDRPYINKGNVVAAVAPPADHKMRLQFVTQLDLQDAELFEKTMQLLKQLPDMGVLLKIEQELPELIRKVYLGKGTGLFAKQEQEGWAEAELRLRNSLTMFAKAVEVSYQGHLFAHDALQGLRMIDLCREKFDAVVMNPPFGRRSDEASAYYDANYMTFKSDIGLAFVDRSASLLRKDGLLGALTSRTFLAGGSFDKWREEVLLDKRPLRSLLDLGIGVLDDAMVETCAFTLGGSGDEETVFVRALEARNKQQEIEDFFNGSSRVNSIRKFDKKINLFRSFPNCIVAYWLPEKIIDGLSKIGTLESVGAATKHGVQTTDDFQFLRLSWEVRFGDRALGNRWPVLAKGGEYAPYFDNMELCIDWKENGERLKSYLAAKRLATQGSPDWTPWMNSPEDYFRPGLTFPARTASDFSPRILPAGCVFTASGQALLFEKTDDALAYLAGAFTRSFKIIVDAFVCSGDNSVSGSAANTYRTSLVNAMPLPCDLSDFEMISIGKEAVSLSVQLTASSELSPFFKVIERKYSNLKELAISLAKKRLSTAIRLLELNEQADGKSKKLHGFDDKTLHDFHGPLPTEYEINLEKVDSNTLGMSIDSLVRLAADRDGPRRQLTKKTFVSDRKLELLAHLNKVHPKSILERLQQSDLWHEFFEFPAEDEASIWFGIAIGRWEISSANEIDLTNFDCFASIPNVHLGTTSSHGGNNSSVGQHEDLYKNILVDDPTHQNDVIRKIRKILDRLWPNYHSGIEGELVQHLSASSLREYFTKPSKFFASHLSRYSGSRRNAPIYWPLATSSCSYTLWLNYQTITNQSLYIAINDFIDPKLKQIEVDLITLKNKFTTRTREEEKFLEELHTLNEELVDMRDLLVDIAPTYKPNYDDGVLISAAPLWQLFRHKPWQKALKDTWVKLEKGEYDWAHLAMAYWPERVREKCKTDKSLAIVHGLQDLYVEPAAASKKTRSKKNLGADE